MKAIKISVVILKWIVILFILLCTIALIYGKSYGQAICWLGIALFLAWWPALVSKRLGRITNIVVRSFIILVLFVSARTIFGSDPKETIYTSPENRAQLMAIYDQKASYWPSETEDLWIETIYGNVHVLAVGSRENPPVVMLHAASMGAHSWAENLDPLLDHYRVYAIDNIGEGNKSKLKDALVYPNSSEDIADFYASLLDSLGVEKVHLFGASNGGYIAQVLTSYHPERVRSLSLCGPMGLTQLTNGSVFRMMLSSMYPLQGIRDMVTKWAIGEDPYVADKYGDWFDCAMRATIPSVAKPIPMTTEQKQEMNLPVLLFLGTEDKIVGDAETAKMAGEEFPAVQIELLESGHLIAVEEREHVNAAIAEFLLVQQ